jgi:hypothetical protein
MIDIFSSFGLAAATGLNAYLPLFIVGLLARYTDFITLRAPWNLLENGWVLLVLAVLLAIEMTVDKIPAVDTANDVIQTAIRPVAGAILFAASNNVITDVSPIMALILGLLMSGSIHAAKATVRPVVTGTTAGIGNPVVSTAEDLVSGGLTLAAILLPVITALLMFGVTVGLIWLFVRWRRGRLPATT